jgi:hypothetical protein
MLNIICELQAVINKKIVIKAEGIKTEGGKQNE